MEDALFIYFLIPSKVVILVFLIVFSEINGLHEISQHRDTFANIYVSAALNMKI